MELHKLSALALLAAGSLAVVVALRWTRRRGWVDPSRERIRRGSGHALLGLQEFVQPSVEYIFQAENLEQAEDEDPGSPDEDDREAVRAGLAASLAADPIDPEEVRRHLAGALRAGLDWRGVFESAVRDELAARPYRRPSLPPAWRVAPRE